MKLLPESTSCLLLLLQLMGLPVLSVSHTTSMSQHKDGLMKLNHQMHRLLKLVQGFMNKFDYDLPFEHDITTLPALHFRPQDFALVEVNSTLSQLFSGLHSFKLHFDWLRYWQEQLGLVTTETKEITEQIKLISTLIQRQRNDLTPQNTVLSLNPPSSAWDIYQTSAVALKKLRHFCDWYVRALRVLNHRRQ